MSNVQAIEQTIELFQQEAKISNFQPQVEELHDNIRDVITEIITNNGADDFSYQDHVLIEALCRFTKHGAMHLIEESAVNKRPIENEIKVLNCFQGTSKLKTYLQQTARKTFEGVVDDTYFDYTSAKEKFPELMTLKDRKISLRIRNKLSSEKKEHTMYYTLKRKLKEQSDEQQSRICLENEFQILNPQVALDNLKGLDLGLFKRKFKYRQSFVLGNTNNTIDIDTYIDVNGNQLIEPFIEFEVENIEDALILIEMFGLNGSEHQILTHGSTGTFKHCGVDYEMMSTAEGILVPDRVLKGKNIERVEM